jgi:hypothetical protein
MSVAVVTRTPNIAKRWGKFQIKCAIVLTGGGAIVGDE